MSGTRQLVNSNLSPDSVLPLAIMSLRRKEFSNKLRNVKPEPEHIPSSTRELQQVVEESPLSTRTHASVGVGAVFGRIIKKSRLQDRHGSTPQAWVFKLLGEGLVRWKRKEQHRQTRLEYQQDTHLASCSRLRTKSQVTEKSNFDATLTMNTTYRFRTKMM